MLKEQKGITLVALIITIIVMLILAGVSISLVVGESGVLTQAQSVEPTQLIASAKEAVALGNADILATYYADTTAEKTEAVSTEADILGVINNNYSGDEDMTWKTKPTLPTETADGAAPDTKTVDAQLVVTGADKDDDGNDDTIDVTITWKDTNFYSVVAK